MYQDMKRAFRNPDFLSHQDLAANTSLPEAHDRRAFEGRRSALLREFPRFVLSMSCNKKEKDHGEKIAKL